MWKEVSSGVENPWCKGLAASHERLENWAYSDHDEEDQKNHNSKPVWPVLHRMNRNVPA